MVGTYTTNLNLYKPVAGEVGWSAAIDNNFDLIDTAVNARAPIASPTFTGVPAAPTAAAGTNTTQLATTAFVKALGDLKALASHTQAASTITDFASAVAALITGKSDTSHTHAYAPATHSFVTVSASDTLIVSDDATVSGNSNPSGTMTIIKTLCLPANHNRGGTYRIKFDVKTTTPNSYYWLFYSSINGPGTALTSTLLHTGYTGSTSFVTISNDLVVPAAGAVLLLATDTANTIHFCNFRVYGTKTVTAP